MNAYGAPPLGSEPPVSKPPFVLAAIGAALAGAYWAALTFLIGVGVAYGGTPSTQVLIPCLLIGLYAFRAWQLYKGEPAALRRIMFLQGVGAAMAILGMLRNTSSMANVLQGVKLAIHVFGFVAGYLAKRQYDASLARA